jgi:hypothetical protein
MAQTNALRTVGTANLLAAAAAVGARRFVTWSMVFGYGYGDHGQEPITEDDPFGPPGRGRFTQHLAALGSPEDQTWSAAGIDGVALRYGWVTGPARPSRGWSSRCAGRLRRCPGPGDQRAATTVRGGPPCPYPPSSDGRRRRRRPLGALHISRSHHRPHLEQRPCPPFPRAPIARPQPSLWREASASPGVGGGRGEEPGWRRSRPAPRGPRRRGAPTPTPDRGWPRAWPGARGRAWAGT